MSGWQYLWRSIRYHWRMLLAVAAGVAVATAVLTGALVVGDSVQGSLRRVTLDRLGEIHSALLADHFFTRDLARRMAADPQFRAAFAVAEPAIWFQRVTVESTGAQPQRTRGVELMGIESTFWDLHTHGPRPARLPQGRQIVLNQPLADELHAKVGDRILVRLPTGLSVAGDSVLADKEDLTRTLADLEVVDIIPAAGLGRFTAQPSQQYPRLAYVPLDQLQAALDKPDVINAVFVSTAQPADPPRNPPDETVRATLEDLGLQLSEVRQEYQPAGSAQPQLAYRYYQLTAERMVFPPGAEPLFPSVLSFLQGEPAITYLVNRFERLGEPVPGKRSVIPYSTISGVSSTGPLSPLASARADAAGSSPTDGDAVSLGDDGLVLNSWTADQLGAQVGDQIRLHYFLPETTDGDPKETSIDLVLKQIVPLVWPAEPYRRGRDAVYVDRPGLTNDPHLTPSVKGVTDQESIDDWDPPFPFDNSLIRPADETYWDAQRTTPKAFVSLETAQRLWSSRFGLITSYRFPASDERPLATVREELEKVLLGQHGEFGFRWLALRGDGLRAAQGTTPFSGLFLGFSFFLILAALLLVLLLFRLMMEQRGQELGLLLAVGIPERRAAGLWLREGLIVAALGGLIGVPLGVGYAALMLWGLRTIWLGAISTPFLQAVIRPATLVLGGALGGLVAGLTIWWTCRRAGRQPARELLVGRLGTASVAKARRSPWYLGLALLLLVLAAVAVFSAARLTGDAQAGAFFGGGVCVLTALLLLLREWLRLDSGRNRRPAIGSLLGLAQQNLARNPGRSLLTIGLLASASFLIVAISAFRLPPTERGTGRFNLVGETDRPVFENLDTAEGRDVWFGTDAVQLANTRVVSLRVRDGDDASCRNLFQSQRPRLLGVPAAARQMLADSQPPRFGWAAELRGDGQPVSPWLQLKLPSPDQPDSERPSAGRPSAGRVIPVVIDKNTALYSLGLTGGAGQEFEKDYGTGAPLRFRVVGLLDNSLLQGVLIVSEEDLLSIFPETAGYRFFLIDVPAESAERASELLERMLGDRGMDVQRSRDVLTNLYAIQNTYLSTFQTLGGLGLLLGTLGLAVVQVRNVLERRRELGLLQALGFARRRLTWLVMGEHFLVLAWGLLAGCLAAAWVVVPHGWAGGAAVPWGALAALLGAVALLGALTGWWAVRRGLSANLIRSLRED